MSVQIEEEEEAVDRLARRLIDGDKNAILFRGSSGGGTAGLQDNSLLMDRAAALFEAEQGIFLLSYGLLSLSLCSLCLYPYYQFCSCSFLC